MHNTHKFNHSLFIFALMILLFVSQSAYAAQRGVFYDYFGTGRSDFLLLNEQNGQLRWDILRNSMVNPQQATHRVFWGFPFPDDFGLYGDYDGDQKNDIGVWRPGDAQNPQSHNYIQLSSDPNPNSIFGVPWGLTSDYPVDGDFDGDGKDDFTVIREEGANYSHYILPSGGGNFRRIVFGLTSDGTYAGGGKFTADARDEIVAIRLAANGDLTIYAADSETGNLVFAQQWGNFVGYDVSLVAFGDYIGDSRADLVHIYGRCGGCANEGTWWIKETGGDGVRVVKFGIPLDAGFVGDYPLFDSDFDGDGKIDIEVFRPENSTFYVLRSSDGQVISQYWDGDSTTPPSNDPNSLEKMLASRSKSIPAAALRGRITVKQTDGTYQTKQTSEFYLKK